MKLIHRDCAWLSDLDDTLAISEALKEAIFYRVLRYTESEKDMQCTVQYNPGFSTKPLFLEWIRKGPSDSEKARRADFYEAFQRSYMQAKEDFYRNEVEAFPDAVPFVEAIADKPAVLVSSNPRAHLELGLERLGWTDVFDDIVAVDDPRIIEPKPHHSPFTVAAVSVNYPLERCVGTGDSMADARSMSEAQIASPYIVHRGEGKLQPEIAQLVQAQKIRIIGSLTELGTSA